MNEQPEQDETLNQNDAGETPAEQNVQPEPAADHPEETELDALRRERDELKDQLLRVTADYQNYVRRAAQHSQSAAEQKLIEVARALMTVLDHFDRALDVDAETTSATSMLEGMTMVRNELLQTLERFGVTRFEVAVGDEFDPNRHEAMMRQSVEGIEANHVTAQFQPGYALGDRTLRPAKVAVAQ